MSKLPPLPFNIQLLSNDRKRLAGLLPVTVLDMFARSGSQEFHPNGLYSNVIFGDQGTKTRRQRHGFIDLKCRVLHPKIFEELGRLKELYRGIMQGVEYATWNAKTKDFDKADVITGKTGYAFFMDHVKEIDFKRTASYRRDNNIELIIKYIDIIDIPFLVVLPAGLRDIEFDEMNRPIEKDINKLYRKVLAAANSISPQLQYKNDPILDRTRWSMQKTIHEVWELIIKNTLSGKKGFMQKKWGSRRVSYSTANVLSAMDPSAHNLDGPRAIDITRTIVGCFQTAKGTEPLLTIWQMPNGSLSTIIRNADYNVPLVDPKTLKRVEVELKEDTRTRWGSEAGRQKLVAAFSEYSYRHDPIMIDGYYAMLIYIDKEKGEFKLFNDIGDLPPGFDKKNVHPLTWIEYFYIELQRYMDRVRCTVVRFPIIGPNSTYQSTPYLKSTVKAYVAVELDEGWQRVENSQIFPELPDSAEKSEFFNTMSPHVTRLDSLDGDFDGDVGPLYFHFAEDSVREIDEKLNSIETYVNATGGMWQSLDIDTLNRVFASFTGFK